MKKIFAILITALFIETSFASNWCNHENSIQAKKLNDTVYDVISKKRASFDLIDQYIFTIKISTKIFQIKEKTQNNTIKCAISWIGYRLNGDKISFSKSIDTNSHKFKLLAPSTQQNILDSQNSMY
jgi:hypothetical protein